MKSQAVQVAVVFTSQYTTSSGLTHSLLKLLGDARVDILSAHNSLRDKVASSFSFLDVITETTVRAFNG